MKNIRIEATERSPNVDFNFVDGKLAMGGESYPEDASAFFGPIVQAIRDFIGSLGSGKEVVFDLDFAYFNSSSAKALMNIFQLLEEAGEKGIKISINWHYQDGDDTMEEFGEDFAEDMEFITFKLCPRNSQ
jgi:hypothetical protein